MFFMETQIAEYACMRILGTFVSSWHYWHHQNCAVGNWIRASTRIRAWIVARVRAMARVRARAVARVRAMAKVWSRAMARV